MSTRRHVPQGRPPTLGEIAADDVAYVRVWCNSCGRYVELRMASLIEMAGPDLYFPRLSERLRCTSCKARDSRVMPLWPARKMGANRDQEPAVDDDNSGNAEHPSADRSALPDSE